MTPEAQKVLQDLETNYRKAAFQAKNYTSYDLPSVANERISLPADSWNSGNNKRIEIPVGAKIRLVTAGETYSLGIGGADTDKLIGLWVSDFKYNQ